MNWAKRVLFLADRVSLVNQAANAFKKYPPNSSPANLVTEKDKEAFFTYHILRMAPRTPVPARPPPKAFSRRYP